MSIPVALWLPAALLLPLLLSVAAVLPLLRERSLTLLPFAPVPALLATILVPAGTVFVMPDVLLGAQLQLEANGRIFLGFSSFLWLMAAVFASRGNLHERDRGGFAALWCLTLAGNLGVFIAGDAVSFYASFTCVSLAAYPLVVHNRTGRAMRAGAVYIVLAVLGETLLLLAFLLTATQAPSLAIPDFAVAIVTAPERNLIVLLLVLGFGIKAGLVPLHVWLPLAHPAAPTPASAVLSGAIVKAGIFGLLTFLPFGQELTGWSSLLLAAGMSGALYGVAIGLTQRNPKTVLAYSTVSQMGLVIAALAAALGTDAAEGALAAVSLYALHHGLAKGALFLGVAVIGATGRKHLGLMLVCLALPAASLAGVPLSGGALAKLGLKAPLAGGVTEFLFTASAVLTTLLLLHFLQRVAAAAASGPNETPGALRLVPWLATALAGLAVPWFLFSQGSGLPLSYALQPANLWTGAWPVLLGLLIYVLARTVPLRAPEVPEGDLAVIPGHAMRLLRSALPTPRRWLGRVRAPELQRLPELIAGPWVQRLERYLSRWSITGVLLLLLVIIATL